MEQNYVNPLPFKHISTAASEAVTYIRRRKNHEIEPLKSRWNKFNEMCCGGIEPGCVYTIVGASGTGKSSFVNTLETDLIDLNTDQDIVILDFSFEMLSYRQIGRKLSNRLRRTTSELYSANDSIDDATLDKVKEEADQIGEMIGPNAAVMTPSQYDAYRLSLKNLKSKSKEKKEPSKEELAKKWQKYN